MAKKGRMALDTDHLKKSVLLKDKECLQLHTPEGNTKRQQMENAEDTSTKDRQKTQRQKLTF